MVSGSKQVDDLCCDANITQEKMKSFNKREICEEQCFIFFEESVANQYRLQQQEECI